MESKKIKMEKVLRKGDTVIVAFRSDYQNYSKEESGIKNNTMRKIDLTDERFQLLRKGEVTHIMIHHVNGEFSFLRPLKDYTEYEGWCVSTWEHID